MNDVLFDAMGVVVTPWKIVGYVGVVTFAGRWFVQVWASHRQGIPTVPRLFWYMSLTGSALLLAVALGIVALLGGGPRWRDAATACVLAGIIGGLAVGVLRPTFGRARPHAAAEPGLYWFEMSAEYHSLPSGHAASNMASAAAVPAVAMAAAISWSRLQLQWHYPTDVGLGLLLGASIGLPIGAATVARGRPPRSTPRARS